MGGGLIQLVAIGAQDVVLTGNPQITFFKTVYRRYTNFSKECIAQDFTGSGNTIKCTLARNGDLVQEIYLQMSYKINSTSLNQTLTINPNTDNTKYYFNSAFVGQVEFKKDDIIYFDYNIFIGSSKILDKEKGYLVSEVILLNSTYNFSLQKYENNIWEDIEILSTGTITGSLNDTYGSVSGVQIKLYKYNKTKDFIDRDMTDIIETIEIEIGGQTIDKHYSKWLDIYNELFEENHEYRVALNEGNINLDVNKVENIYIPLRFWFNKNIGLALPLISLQYHDVVIIVNLKNMADVNIVNNLLLVNYIYLDVDERRKFSELKHEYLIEQVQFTGEEILYEGVNHINLNYNHPIKSLFWTTTGKSYIEKANLQLNGHDRFAELNADYFHLIQPYETNMGHTYKLSLNSNKDNRKWTIKPKKCSMFSPVGMYSFCLKPKDYQPSGSCNFSKIDNARFNYNGLTKDRNNDTLYLFALNYNVFRVLNGMGGLVYSN
tara:strand:- start:6451 stop:7923 length:1473 start_codon:yes stop_codon:yes gene_type:complete